MPGMDGGELAVHFRANSDLKSVPIVFLTSAVTKAEVTAGGGWVGGSLIPGEAGRPDRSGCLSQASPGHGPPFSNVSRKRLMCYAAGKVSP